MIAYLTMKSFPSEDLLAYVFHSAIRLIMSVRLSGETEPSLLFPTTEWTVLLDPVRRGGSQATQALEQLCRRYWSPLFIYVRRRGYDHHQAEEIVQDFIASLLGRDAFAKVERRSGRFRAFLLACLKNFIATRYEHQCAQKRGHGRVPCSLENLGDAAFSTLEEDVTAFDRPWAVEVFQASLRQIEEEYVTAGKCDWFGDLKPFITGDQPLPDRLEIALKRAVQVGAVDVAVHRLRRRFGVILRSLVAQTVNSADSVDAELEYLITLVSS